MKTAFGLIHKHLQAVISIASSANLATGKASIPELPQFPAAAPSAPRRSRKRSAAATATATQANEGDEGQTGETGTQEGEPPTKQPLVSSRMESNQCCCGLKFDTRQDLETHLDASHPKGCWPCSLEGCGKSYSTGSKVWKHYRQTHLGIYHHYCVDKDCNYGNDEITTVKYHQEIAHGIRTDVRCPNPNCDRPFSQKNKLENHKKICGHKMKVFPCEVPDCPRAFRSQASLLHHMKTDHPQLDKSPLRFSCPDCQKKFKTKLGLKEHSKKHA